MGSPRGMPGNDENNYYPRNTRPVRVAPCFARSPCAWKRGPLVFSIADINRTLESLDPGCPFVVTELAKPEFTCFVLIKTRSEQRISSPAISSEDERGRARTSVDSRVRVTDHALR